MTFLTPIWLLLLLPVAALAAAYVVVLRRRQRYAVRFASLPMLERVVPRRPGWRRHVPATLVLLALTCLGLAAARPEMTLRLPYDRATVMVAIDTSGSMAATDVPPNRLEAAKAAAVAFVDDLPDTVNVGVVSFAGQQCRRERTDDRPRPGPGADRLPRPRRGRHGDRRGGVQLARSGGADDRSKLTVNRCPLGWCCSPTARTPPGVHPSRLPRLPRPRPPCRSRPSRTAPRTGPSRDRSGSSRVPVDEAALRELAEATGGTAYTAESGEELRDVYDDIGSSIGWRTEQREVTPYLAALGLLVVVGAGALSLRWFSRLI